MNTITLPVDFIRQMELKMATMQAGLDDLTGQVKILKNQVIEKDALITKQSALISKQAALIQHYEAQLSYLKRRQFGSTSERLMNEGQMSLFGCFLGTTDITTNQIILPPPPDTEEITYKRKKRKGKREEDLSNLPRVKEHYELTEEERICPSCNAIMRDIGTNSRCEIEIIPAQAIVKEHITHSYACKNSKCPGTYPVKSGDAGVPSDVDTQDNSNAKDNSNKLGGSQVIIKANSPKPLIAGSLASPSLVAHIIHQKYTNAMPLYRLEKGFRYDGVAISRQNMSYWVIKCSEVFLYAIYERLIEHLLKEEVIHSDPTSFQVLKEPGRAAQTKSNIWVYRTSGHSKRNIVIYEYTQTKGAENLKRFLGGFSGFVHSDGADTYKKLAEDYPQITIVGCWAHARRKFEEALKLIPKDARNDSDVAIGLAYINALFKLERDFAGCKKKGIQALTPDEVYLARFKQSKPISDAFFTWAKTLDTLPSTPLGKAITYALNQKSYLENVFLDDRLELSNNRAERSIKPFVIGRKNWLFANTPEGATASAISYSIIETATENDLHPFHYIKHLLETLPNSTYSDIDALLPWSETLPDWCRISSERA